MCVRAGSFYTTSEPASEFPPKITTGNYHRAARVSKRMSNPSRARKQAERERPDTIHINPFAYARGCDMVAQRWGRVSISPYSNE